MGKIKVFQLNEYDWWAGEDLEKVKIAYIKENNLSIYEVFDDTLHELSDEEMLSTMFGNDEDESQITFQQRLGDIIKLGAVFPCFFASTEY